MKEVLNIGSIPDIEIEIYQREDAYFPDLDLRQTLQKKLLQDAFQFHFNNNSTYRQYVIDKGIPLKEIYDDFRNIPLIPSTIFKKTSIRTATQEMTVKNCLSSGTQGSVSTVQRDNTTLERFVGSVRNALDNVLKIEDGFFLNLGPSSEEAKDVWFSYVMSISDLIFPTKNYVRNDTFNIRRFIEDIYEASDEYREIVVIGAPIMLLHLYNYFKSHKISLEFGDRIFVVTAGGWKKFDGQSVSKSEFKSYCKEMFTGIRDENIRDVFNMVELNTVLPECSHGSKHVPVWLEVFAIDLETFEIGKPGEVGLLAFLDASPMSYPGFVMSGDLGRISYIDNCPCGNKGVCIDIIRRINTIESRGCALKIEKGCSSH